MASRKLTFDASRPSSRNLGASPAARSPFKNSPQQNVFVSPTHALGTPTRSAQRAALSRMQQSRRETIAFGAPLLSPTTSRRNPLQAITEQELQRGNQLQQIQDNMNLGARYAPRAVDSKQQQQHPHQADMSTHRPETLVLAHGAPNAANADNGDASANAGTEAQSQQTKRVAEWIFAYRRAFPNFVFYFEGIDETTQQRLSAPIRALGARVETFFSAQAVTHVVVESASALGENAANSSHVVALARRFQLKIWDVEKLEKRVLAFLLPGFNVAAAQGPSVVSAKRKLNEAFSAEKLYAMRHKTYEGAAVSHGIDFYYFKHYYVLAEDSTHLNRPAIMEDFRPPPPGRDPPWPKLYMVPTGRCPFVQYDDPTTSSKESDSDTNSNKENLTPEPEPTMPTAPLLSKTPASRLQNTPRRQTWAPAAIRAVAEEEDNEPKPFSTVQAQRAEGKAAAHDPLLTPTRPSRGFSVTATTNLLLQRPELRNYDASGVMDSNASGIGQGIGVTSTSTAFHVGGVDPVLQQSLLQNLNGGLVTHLSKLEQPVARIVSQKDSAIADACKEGRVPPAPRTKKPRVPVRRPVVAKPGYCENCRVKYDDMMAHVKSAQHRRFAANERNWLDLDALLDKVRRPLRKQDSDLSSSHSLYALSSDDAAHGIIGSAGLSAPASLHENWDNTTFGTHRFAHPSASAHLLASGRIGTESPTTAIATDGAAVSVSTVSRPAASIIDLTFSNSRAGSNSASSAAEDDNVATDNLQPTTTTSATVPPVTPVAQRAEPTAEKGTVEALVSSLETPQFRSHHHARPSSLYEDAATLVSRGAAGRGQRFDQQSTPTQNSKHADILHNDAGISTLVQPSRVLAKACPESSIESPSANEKPKAAAAAATAKASIKDRHAMAERLCHLLHGEPDDSL
ncbi:Cdc7p-Dbf4p kinase complex regulatory subunit [Coemansia asiatica]|uniref:Cdc7p-Dbf4p kinase complex regulatory subunit n=1 Tax=Coemansia asiatica TaxID=1052880 RepID=A0A9W8CJM7_9FUNG|nr:Cdc7p-Dbf4p kinase complex regulatory subunit [Coemansia asiatica]